MIRMESNVVCTSKYRSSTIHGLFFVILVSLFLCQENEAVFECDFTKCITSIRSFIQTLRSPGARFVCKNVLNSPWCSEYCMHHYFPNILLQKSVNQTFIQYCDENLSNRKANWSCIARHSFQLLTCLANVSSLTSNNVHEDMMLSESCRKSHEFQNCPTDVLLSDCGKTSVDVVKDILQFVLNNFIPSSCKGTKLKEVFSMPVYYHLGSEYMEAAKSFDYYFIFLLPCFSKVVDEDDLNGFLCGDRDYVTDCINFELDRRNKSFPAVRMLLLKYLLVGDFKCTQPVTELKSINPTPISEMDSNSHVLTDENDNLSIFPETSTFSFSKDNENFHLKTSAGTAVKSITEKTDQKIVISDFSEHKSSDSHENISSEKPVNHNSANYMKTSSAPRLHYDITLAVLLLLFVFA